MFEHRFCYRLYHSIRVYILADGLWWPRLAECGLVISGSWNTVYVLLQYKKNMGVLTLWCHQPLHYLHSHVGTRPPALLSLLFCFLALPEEWAGSLLLVQAVVSLPQACSENNCSMNCQKHHTDQNVTAMTYNLLFHLACLILQLRALCVDTTCQTACLFLLLLLLLCPGLDLCHLWCCLCLGGILQQWQKRALILNCHYLLGCGIIRSGKQAQWFCSFRTDNPFCSKRLYIALKHSFLFTRPEGLTPLKTVIFMVTVVRTSTTLSHLFSTCLDYFCLLPHPLQGLDVLSTTKLEHQKCPCKNF